MKKVGVVGVLLLCVQFASAQTFNEWFRQKKTQIDYLMKQIAALQVYISHVKQGYEIAQQGLQTIGAIKDGDFNLHRDFFGALKTISPRIRNSVQVAEIISYQVRIIESQRRSLSRVRGNDELGPEEIDYIVKVYARLVEQSLGNIEELIILLTADAYTMNDEERIRRIGSLHADMQEKARFAQWFSDQASVLVLRRKKELQDARIGQQLLLQK